MAFIDETRGTAYRRLRFHSKVKLPWEKTALLFAITPFDQNWRRLNAGLLNKSALVVIAIMNIEYSDGSRWQRQ
jgi:hypothetical protein